MTEHMQQPKPRFSVDLLLDQLATKALHGDSRDSAMKEARRFSSGSVIGTSPSACNTGEDKGISDFSSIHALTLGKGEVSFFSFEDIPNEEPLTAEGQARVEQQKEDALLGGIVEFREEQASFVLKPPLTVSIFGGGYQGGQPIGGVETAPKALRDAGLLRALYNLGWTVKDLGDVKDLDETEINGDPPVHGIKSPRRVAYGCEQVYKAAYVAASEGHLAFTIGGDHSCAIGSILGVASQYPDVGVIWVDAHADLNTPDISPSGNFHGMPVAFLLGLCAEIQVPGMEWFRPCITPDRIVYIGLRDVDFIEKRVLHKLGIKAFSMHEIDKYGIGKVMQMALDHISPLRQRPIHLSFDSDAVDPIACPSTGTPVMGGLTFREAAFLCESVAETGLMVGFDFVEVNPQLGTEDECNRTLQVALSLIKSAMGPTHRLEYPLYSELSDSSLGHRLI